MREGFLAEERRRAVVADAIRKTMQSHCGVFRTGALLAEGVRTINALAERALAAAPEAPARSA